MASGFAGTRHRRVPRRPGSHRPGAPELATFDHLNTWYYTDAPRTHRPELERARRQSTFDEWSVPSLRRTLSSKLVDAFPCGNCFECDNCFRVCPDNAVIKLGPSQRYEIHLDFCKGCGMCAQECPCGAINMVPEQNLTQAAPQAQDLGQNSTRVRRASPEDHQIALQQTRPCFVCPRKSPQSLTWSRGLRWPPRPMHVKQSGSTGLRCISVLDRAPD